MSTVTKSWAPTRSDPLAAAARKRKVLLVVLVVMLVGVLAFELPRLMHRSSASSPSSAAPATDSGQTGLVTDQIAPATDTAAAQNAATAQTTAAAQAAAGTGGAVAASAGVVAIATAPRVSKATVLAIRHRPAKDPFAPLLGQPVDSTASAATPASAPATSPATSSTTTSPTPAPSAPSEQPKAATPAPAPAPAEATATPESSAPSSTPTSTSTGTPTSTPTTTPTATPTVVPVAVKPDVAVVYANGKKQAVGVDQYFEAGDLWFQLLSVGPKTMEISVVGGAFAGGKDAITVNRNQPITLVNTATGVEYTLRFTKAAAGIATTSQAEPTRAPTTTAAPPSEATDPATDTSTVPAGPIGATTTTPPSGS